jgi:hypothetical protein
VKIRSGISLPQDVLYEGDIGGEALAIFISEEDPTTVVRWLVKVYVHVAQGWFMLGFITTNTVATDSAPSRFVASASCPGAIGWMVQFQNAFAGANDGFDAEVTLQVGKCCGSGPYGVFVPPQPPGDGGGGGGGT